MKKTYIIPAQRWAIMEENFLQSLSVEPTKAAKSEFGMDSRDQFEGGSDSNGNNLWNDW